jgi:hypothetical protein
LNTANKGNKLKILIWPKLTKNSLNLPANIRYSQAAHSGMYYIEKSLNLKIVAFVGILHKICVF